MVLLSVQIYFITKAFSVREKVMNGGIKGMNGRMLSKIYSYMKGTHNDFTFTNHYVYGQKTQSKTDF